MKTSTANSIAMGIQILHLDGYKEYTVKQLASVSGISTKTLHKNSDLVSALDYAIGKEDYINVKK